MQSPEAVAKLQSSLEETVTKNLQLQHDIDTLGNEIMRLSNLLKEAKK